MKVRNGFVSNSSSSSFVCDVCGHSEGGWDMCLSEAEMMECGQGHVFCTSEIVSLPDEESFKLMVKYTNMEIKHYEDYVFKYPNETRYQDSLDRYTKLAKELASYTEEERDKIEWEDEFKEQYFDGNYDIPPEFCPICSLEHIDSDDLYSFLLKKLDMKSIDIKSEIWSKFKSHSELRNYLIE